MTDAKTSNALLLLGGMDFVGSRLMVRLHAMGREVYVSGAGKARASAARGSATLSGTPPTKNTHGSRLTDLAGYKIYYGTSEKYLQRVIVVDDPSATAYRIKDLPRFIYYISP